MHQISSVDLLTPLYEALLLSHRRYMQYFTACVMSSRWLNWRWWVKSSDCFQFLSASDLASLWELSYENETQFVMNWNYPFAAVPETRLEMNSLLVFFFQPLCWPLLSSNLSFLLRWMRVFQPGQPSRTGKAGGACVPGWIQETFILLFSLGTMC